MRARRPSPASRTAASSSRPAYRPVRRPPDPDSIASLRGGSRPVRGPPRRVQRAERRGYNGRVLITISGLPGSGKTTVARLVAEALDLEHVYAGDIFRRQA